MVKQKKAPRSKNGADARPSPVFLMQKPRQCVRLEKSTRKSIYRPEMPMRSVEIQAFIDKVWIERGIFVHIDSRMPDAILTKEMDLDAENTMPRAILAPNLDSAKAMLAKIV